MSKMDRVTRLARWIPTVPGQLRTTQDTVVATAAQVAEVRATLEAASKAQLEALRFLTRSVNDLSARLDRLAQESEDAAG